MKMRKLIVRGFLLLLLIALGMGIRYAWQAFPIISGYGAKNLCSGVFLQHRPAAEIEKEELGAFPLTLAHYTIDPKDSSVTGTVWGLARQKAIYRQGVGCTLLNDYPESVVRKQVFDRPPVPAGDRDTIPWPQGDQLPDTIPEGVDVSLLYAAVDSAFREKDPQHPVRTRALLVVYNGQLVAEKYAPGFDRNTLMLGWSMSKSITAALIGILVKQGKLKVDASAPVPGWEQGRRHKIKLQYLLQQTSGLDFEEDYSHPSDATNMLFRRGDMAAFTARHRVKYEPGTVFSYSSGNTNILSAIIRRTVGETGYTAFPFTSLFYKIDAYSMTPEPDASGTYVGSSYLYATARDYARFGLLYYYDGVWNGERILPEGWVRQTVKAPRANLYGNYGYQFWLNGMNPKDPRKRVFPDVPDDLYYADGYQGQNIYIIPSRKLVVVRLSLASGPFDENGLLKNILAALP